MSEQPRESDRVDLIADLSSLRKGAGLTLAKISRSPTLLSACAATRSNPQPAYDRIVQSLGALEARRSTQALQAAFNLTEDHAATLLDARRKSFAAANARKKDAVKNWEDDAIEELALLLLGVPPMTALPTATQDVHHAFVMEDLEIIARYDKHGCFAETVQTRKVISLVDNADGFIYATHNSTKLTMVHGGTITELDHQPNGAVRHKIMFPTPLQRGESTDFAFREQQIVPDDGRPLEDRVNQLFHIPTRRFWVQAQFAGDPPPVAWSFDKLTYFERPGQPTKENKLAAHGGKITAEYTNLFGGLAAGLAWRW
jgi:hypothetical protein